MIQYRRNIFAQKSRGDSAARVLAIGHKSEDGIIVVDAIREIRPPFSPEFATDEEYAVLLKFYVSTSGWRQGEWPRQQFRKHGTSYEVAPKPASDLYCDLLPTLNGGKISLPNIPRLIVFSQHWKARR